MTMHQEANVLPPLLLSDVDHQRLAALLDTEVAAVHAQAADVLRNELDRAQIVAEGRVPGDVVTMGSRVLYADSFGTRAEVELVFPWDASTDGRRVSVLSPLGASLIGLREGARFDWHSANGRVRRVTVLSVRGRPTE
jgi:regulator of nucleoside diphosphate kinase